MKKLLLFLAVILTTSLFAQRSDNEGRIITYYMETQSMVWSEYQQKNIYTVTSERSRHNCTWTFNLNNDGSGQVNMEDLETGDKYLLIIYDWKVDMVGERDGIVGQFIQKIDGTKGTIIIQNNEYGEHMVSVFMPETELHLTFDNMRF